MRLSELGEGGKWPPFLDVLVEHEGEKVAGRSQQGCRSTAVHGSTPTSRAGTKDELIRKPERNTDNHLYIA